jgi:murein DD-endopeptidase MepM/ murein hydrolase activator NlpD
MNRIAFLFLLVFFLACASAKVPRDKPYLPYSKRNGIYYLIKSGDSLWKISKQYNVSVEKLMRENNISSPYNLQVGQKIFIPRYPVPATAKSFLWPLKGNIINYFNESVDNSLNRGLNIQTTGDSREVRASAEGRVVFSNPLKGWGKTIILKHSSNFYTVYANLEKTLVKEGILTEKGKSIGTVALDKN